VEITSVQTVIHVEAFNKLCRALKKVSNAQRSDWDLRVPVVLWAYRVMCKKLTGQTTSSLVYEANAEILMKYIMLSPRIAVAMDTIDRGALKEGIAQLEKKNAWDLMKRSNTVILGSKNS